MHNEMTNICSQNGAIIRQLSVLWLEIFLGKLRTGGGGRPWVLLVSAWSCFPDSPHEIGL